LHSQFEEGDWFFLDELEKLIGETKAKEDLLREMENRIGKKAADRNVRNLWCEAYGRALIYCHGNKKLS